MAKELNQRKSQKIQTELNQRKAKVKTFKETIRNEGFAAEEIGEYYGTETTEKEK